MNIRKLLSRSLLPAFLAVCLASATQLPSASAQAVAPGAAKCQATPGSLDALAEASNAKYGHYQVYRHCFPDGQIHTWAMDEGILVNGRIYDEQGRTQADLTISRNWGSDVADWQMIVGASLPHEEGYVQTWTLNITSGASVDMKLAAVNFYDSNLTKVEHVTFAADGVSPQRVDRLRPDGQWNVEFWRADGSVWATGLAHDADGTVTDLLEHPAAENLRTDPIPAAWLGKFDLTGIPMPSDAH